MPLDPSAENTATIVGIQNLKQIAGHDSWANAQRQTALVAHQSRNDQFAELAYQNAIADQQFARQSAADYANDLRTVSKMYFGSLANKLLNQDLEQSMAEAQVMKGNADSTILSILGQLSGGQISAKVAQSTPYKTPDNDFLTGLAFANTLNQQNYSNNSTNRDLAAVGAMLAEIVMKNATTYPVPTPTK